MRVYRSFNEPKRQDRTFENLWRQEDEGLIAAWEIGRDLREKHNDLAKKATNGELPVTGYKGGVDPEKQVKKKFGSLKYLAEWQALRGEDLSIDQEEEVVIECSRTGVIVTFTGNLDKLKN